MHQIGSDGYLFSLFLWLLELKVKKGSLTHVKTWFGRRFCCLMIYANLHNLPRICIKMAPTGTFFTFLWLLELKVKKGSLAHDKTWFGRRLCCLVLYANLHNLPCICIKMAPTETVSLFLWLLELKVKKGSLEHGITWFGRHFCCLVISANLHNLPCICIKMAPTGIFFHFSCDCWN